MYIYIYIYTISILYQATLMSCGTAKHVSIDCTITLLLFGVVEHSVTLVWVSFSNNAKPTTLVVVWALCPHIALCSLDVRTTAVVPQEVVTDNRLGINSCHAISRWNIFRCYTDETRVCRLYYIYIYAVQK